MDVNSAQQIISAILAAAIIPKDATSDEAVAKYREVHAVFKRTGAPGDTVAVTAHPAPR